MCSTMTFVSIENLKLYSGKARQKVVSVESLNAQAPRANSGLNN